MQLDFSSRVSEKRNLQCAVLAALLLGICQSASSSECQELDTRPIDIIWCDDFEDADLPASGDVADSYYDFNSLGGRLTRVQSEARNGSFSLRQTYERIGDTSAGYFFRTFGRSPLSSQSHSDRDFREIYWRFYVKHEADFVGRPSKLTRATAFASQNRSQAMIGHVWIESAERRVWMLDPASGTDESGVLRSTRWNDFANLRWLGQGPAFSPIRTGVWQCIEANIRLNSPGQSDGSFRLWIDDQIEAERLDLNWVGDFGEVGINAVMIESEWGDGSPAAQSRFIDSLVIATQRIGCSESRRPARITDIAVE